MEDRRQKGGRKKERWGGKKTIPVLEGIKTSMRLTRDGGKEGRGMC